MDALMKLSRDVRIVLGGAVLYIIFSFFDWQQVSVGSFTYGYSEWSGIGVVAALIAIVLLAWELARAFDVRITLGSITPGLASAGLAALLLLFTVITFLTHGTARHWPSYIGLILSLVIGGAAFKRARDEGVEIPTMPRNSGPMGGGTSSGGGSSSLGSSGGPADDSSAGPGSASGSA
jgi:hypothetical protein